MHVNYGLVPPLADPPRGKAEKRAALAARAREDLRRYLATRRDLLPDGGTRP